MKSLAVYKTKRGSVKKSLEYLSTITDLDMKMLKDAKNDDFKDYYKIIIAGSIHAGRLDKNLVKFIKDNIEIIEKSNVYLLINCGDRNGMMENLKLNLTYSNLSCFKGIFHGGYAYYFDKMNFFEKFILKNLIKIKESKEFINKEDLERLAETLKE